MRFLNSGAEVQRDQPRAIVPLNGQKAGAHTHFGISKCHTLLPALQHIHVHHSAAACRSIYAHRRRWHSKLWTYVSPQAGDSNTCPLRAAHRHLKRPAQPQLAEKRLPRVIQSGRAARIELAAFPPGAQQRTPADRQSTFCGNSRLHGAAGVWQDDSSGGQGRACSDRVRHARAWRFRRGVVAHRTHAGNAAREIHMCDPGSIESFASPLLSGIGACKCSAALSAASVQTANAVCRHAMLRNYIINVHCCQTQTRQRRNVRSP
jgi:hypothetical protein